MLDKTYQPHWIEEDCLAAWGPFTFQPSGLGQAWCLMLPPPNVTGSLHMGHGFQVSLMDALVRYQRMMGQNVLWQGGTDHAGIATQMVVERHLARLGQTREQLGRARFLEAVWDFQTQSGNHIQQQLKRLGASIDSGRDRFTQDPAYIVAVTHVFIKLYEAGLLYRGRRLVNWDPQLLTAVSDLEVLHSEEEGTLYYLRYPLKDGATCQGKTDIVVATTRPETLFGDVAIAVNPQDSRYQALIGQKVRLPLTDKLIPIIADADVEATFGTGCVKITPAHDFNDHALGKRHNLPMINVLTPTAQLNDQVPAPYRGMDRFLARDDLIRDLMQQGQVEKTEPYRYQVPRGDRSGSIIEPYLTDQWFMRMQPLAAPVIAAIKASEIRFVPENWTSVCLQWLENIEDWCISRQLWWGHRLPVWYGPQGEIFVGEDIDTVRKRYNLSLEVFLKQDEDVLDTWVSSVLWPFVTLGWPEKTQDFGTFYPTCVLITGFDILFFWVARMLMLGLHFTGQLPFKTVYVTGLVRDHLGQKMSKSKGNGLDPVDIIEGIDLEALIQKRTQDLIQPQKIRSIEQSTRQQFPQGIPALGADALRFTYYALASPTRDIRFDLGRAIGYRNFCNKLWQATRFVLSHSDGELNPAKKSIFDRWIMARLAQTIQQAHAHFETYRFDLLAQALYEFAWYDVCDWYLEWAKPVFSSQTMESPESTRYHLIQVFTTLFKLLHPLMPFITERLWQAVSARVPNLSPLSKAHYPILEAVQDTEALGQVSTFQEIVRAIRSLRSELGVAPSKQITLIVCGYPSDWEWLQGLKAYWMALTRVKEVTWLNEAISEYPHRSLNTQYATTQVGKLAFWIPLAGIIDVETEINRLTKEEMRLQRALDNNQTRLSNPNFVSRAKEAVVEETRIQIASDSASLSAVKRQIKNLTSRV